MLLPKVTGFSCELGCTKCNCISESLCYNSLAIFQVIVVLPYSIGIVAFEL